jgi:hypothetical protein
MPIRGPDCLPFDTERWRSGWDGEFESPLLQRRVHCELAYLRDNPDVSIDLRNGDQLIDLLEEGFDLAIRAYLPPDSSLMVRRLAGWRHVLCCAPSYLERHPAPRRPTTIFVHRGPRFSPCWIASR